MDILPILRDVHKTEYILIYYNIDGMRTYEPTNRVDRRVVWFSNTSFNYVFNFSFKFRQFKLPCLLVKSVPKRRTSIVT